MGFGSFRTLKLSKSRMAICDRNKIVKTLQIFVEIDKIRWKGALHQLEAIQSVSPELFNQL